MRNETNELVEGNAALDGRSELGEGRHVCVNLLVEEPHEDRLVANETKTVRAGNEQSWKHLRLVMTLGICDSLLSVAAVGKCVGYVADIPVLVLLLL